VSAQKNNLQIIEGSGELLPPTPRIDLHDACAIRRELASVYRDARAGKIETQEATRLAYILDLLRRAYETSQLQDRIESLERTIETRRKK